MKLVGANEILYVRFQVLTAGSQMVIIIEILCLYKLILNTAPDVVHNAH
jgi:hypothetical protein